MLVCELPVGGTLTLQFVSPGPGTEQVCDKCGLT